MTDVSRAAALDRLNAALSAAGEFLYSLNLGVSGAVPLSPGRTLLWTKAHGKWGLYVEYADTTPHEIIAILQTSAQDRKNAATILPALLQDIRSNLDEETAEIKAATAFALAFARGEHG